MKQNRIRVAALVIAAGLAATACTDSSANTTTATASSAITTTASSSVTSDPATTSTANTSTGPTKTSVPTTAPTTQKSTTKTSATKSTKTSVSVPPADERFVITIPDKLTAKERKAAETGVAVFRATQDIYDKSLIDPKAKDWPTLMAKYLADPALAAWRIQAFTPALEHGFHQVGYTSVDGAVTGVDLTPAEGFAQSVSMAVCMDASKVSMLDKNGEPLDITGGNRAKWTAVVENLPKVGWRIRTLVTADADGKTVKC